MEKSRYAYILVEEERWWNRRCARNKSGAMTHAFVRRGKVGPKEASKILFYVKLPAKQIKGYGEFLGRFIGPKDELWNLYGAETVFETKDEYDKFVDARSNVTFIRFRGLEEFEKPIGFEVFHLAAGVKKMPNGGMYISKETLNSIVGKEV